MSGKSSFISVFDLFKVGVGPSSSHTLGPWVAALRFIESLKQTSCLESVTNIHCDLYGSLAKTGHGHGTDLAVVMGLSGEDPTQCESGAMPHFVEKVRNEKTILLGGKVPMPFHQDSIVFHREISLPYHPNGMRFLAMLHDGKEISETYYSVGGGFVEQEGDANNSPDSKTLPFVFGTAAELKDLAEENNLTLAQLARKKEMHLHSEAELDEKLDFIFKVMEQCVFDGCHTAGFLPGGLNVKRRAKELSERLLGDERLLGPSVDDWYWAISESGPGFEQVVNWVSCFALAVNEQNGAYGRVVTAPTNGSAGVIPAVLLYSLLFGKVGTLDREKARDFLLASSQIGILFKKEATISAAMGGCQAEIGVSSAMAAAALAESLGGTTGQVLMAAEIAMEHHLGLTCDPIGGLVQVPCIERNTMGAIKAIAAAELALASDPKFAKVSLDDVVITMWNTAQDMNTKYKETSEGGLAVKVAVNVIEC